MLSSEIPSEMAFRGIDPDPKALRKGSNPTTRFVDPLQGRGRPGGLDIGYEDQDVSHLGC